MLVIAVKLVVAPENAEKFEARLKQHAENSKTQEGCVGFVVAADRAQKGAYNLWETYKDDDAFQEHVNADFMADFREFSKDLVIERVLAQGDQIN